MANWYPDPSIPPIKDIQNELTWLSITPKEVTDVNLKSRSSSGGLKSEESMEPTMNFLLPKEFSYSISHTWEDYSSVVGLIKEGAVKIGQQYGQAKGIGVGISSVVSAAKANGTDITSAILTFLDNSGPKIEDIAMKNDNPVIYTNSQRLSFSVTLDLAAYSDPETEVMWPINQLMKLSSPSDNPKNVYGLSFDYPYIFDVSTVCGLGNISTMLKIKNAVITSIQPEFRGPYVNGFPLSASVTVSFMDIDPLFRTNSFVQDINSSPISVTSTKKKPNDIRTTMLDRVKGALGV